MTQFRLIYTNNSLMHKDDSNFLVQNLHVNELLSNLFAFPHTFSTLPCNDYNCTFLNNSWLYTCKECLTKFSSKVCQNIVTQCPGQNKYKKMDPSVKTFYLLTENYIRAAFRILYQVQLVQQSLLLLQAIWRGLP